MRTYSSKLLCALAVGALVVTPAVGQDTVTKDVLRSEIVFEPEYATPASPEQGAFVHASPAPADELDLTIDVMRALTPEQITQALGGTDGGLTGIVAPADQQLELIEVRATREQFDPIHTTIPLGLASLAWAMQNPSEAWRIVFPVLG